MQVVEWRSVMPASAGDVYSWYTRPGAGDRYRAGAWRHGKEMLLASQ